MSNICVSALCVSALDMGSVQLCKALSPFHDGAMPCVTSVIVRCRLIGEIDTHTATEVHGVIRLLYAAD